MIKSVRGTRDLLPPETALWNFVEAAARDVFRAYNFQEIRTPIFESTELFARGVGEETDIVAKEMFTWEDGLEPADYAVYEEWLVQHYTGIDAFARLGPDYRQRKLFGPTLHVHRKGSTEPTIVRFRYRATLQDVHHLTDVRERWKPRRPALLLVTLSGALPKNVRSLAEKEGIEIEVLTIDNLVAPAFLTLRPENTAGVVRAYIQHGLEKRGLNKLFYIGPQFRRERPQKGRYRQFYQIGAEAIGPPAAGSESPARDAEILEMLATFLDRLGIQDWTLQLNTVGCANDRPRYHEALRAALSPVVAKMCADCQRREVTNPLRVFDCKVPEDQPIIAKLPTIGEFLDEPCRAHFAEVRRILSGLNIPFVLNDRLVRGLDYYEKTAFEFTHDALGAQNAILGGGRYDGLSETLGGPRAPGIGFAIGEDRLILSLRETAEALAKKPDAYIAPLGTGMNAEAAKLARELRRHDLIIELGDESFRLKKSLETASKIGARYVVIVGENEVKAGAFALKNLATGEQVTVPRGELPGGIQS